MKIKKVFTMGDRIPCWYGVAWIEWRSVADGNVYICYLFPINWIMAGLRKVWINVRHVPVKSKALQPYKDVLIERIYEWEHGQCQWEDVIEAIDKLVKQAKGVS